MTDATQRATRGHGVLESFLARKRCAMALKLLAPHFPIDRILDIGCGAYPHLLDSIRASERVGIDQYVVPEVAERCARNGIRLIAHDIARAPALPFGSDYFDGITMLAVVEHIPPDRARTIAKEAWRVLKPGGAFVVTTPAAWTDGILKIMARMSLVSSEEIDEHKSLFTLPTLTELLHAGGFARENIRAGTFEGGMNLWSIAAK